jgi:hypothetical protein
MVIKFKFKKREKATSGQPWLDFKFQKLKANKQKAEARGGEKENQTILVPETRHLFDIPGVWGPSWSEVGFSLTKGTTSKLFFCPHCITTGSCRCWRNVS